MSQPPDYRQALTAGGYFPRADRSLIEITGKDRAAWLHNLVTNAVKTLSSGEGNYAFATNVKGRVVFDGNILILPDGIWFDLDARLLATAMRHFDRYVITEDVRLTDLSGATGRIGVFGPRVIELVSSLGFGNLAPMSQLQHVAGEIAGASVRMLRHDFTGLPGAEFIAVGEHRERGIERIAEAAAQAGLANVSADTVRVLRMEAGIPASVDDIDEDVVPPETLQVERGISYHKGCYLGQEVIERMRSHNILARKLVGLRVDGAADLGRNSPVQVAGQDVGRVTSCCHSPALGATLALGYIKSIHAKPGVAMQIATAGGSRAAEVVAVPVRR